MIQSAIRRRPAYALTFALLFAVPAIAQSVTGTDPCPKGTVCSSGNKTAVTTTKTSTAAPSTTSDSSAAMQMLMSLLGLS